MINPLNKRYRPFFIFLERKRQGTFFTLTLEKLAHHTWRLFSWSLLFTGLWMLAVPAFLNHGAQSITLLIFLGGLTYFTSKDLRTFRFPSVEEIDKHLEHKSALGQGHIALIKDQLSNPAINQTRKLWYKAQRDSLLGLRKLRIPLPDLSLSKQDPHALRFIALFIFISGAFIAGHSWKERIINGLTPIHFPPASTSTYAQKTDLWITPPSYTQKPQIHLSGNGYYKGTLSIPEGSTYRLRTRTKTGRVFLPHLHIHTNVTKEKQTLPLKDLGDNLYGTEGTISSGNSLRLKQALLPKARWNYTYIPDQPPKISTTSEPPYTPLKNGELRFPLTVKDDYGVKELRMTMHLNEIIKDAPLGKETQETRLIMSPPNEGFKITPLYDLTGHSWAGLPVTIEFTVTDQKGQNTKSKRINLTLPERAFKHPLAKALIAARKELIWHYKDPFEDTAHTLEQLLNRPNSYQNDKTIFLALRSSASRLYHNDNKPQEQRIKAASSVLKLLWQTALSIEDGNLSLSLREMRDARRNLEKALLDPDTSKQDLSSIMETLREKMAAYFMERQREMQKRMTEGQNPIPDDMMANPENFSSLITPNSLATLMGKIGQALQEGDTQKAQELMAQFQRMMEMMDSASQNTELPHDMQMMQQGASKLQDIIERQKELIDAEETQKEATKNNETKQESLLHVLQDLIKDTTNALGENKVPKAMHEGAQEMKDAALALKKNTPANALPHQQKAIEHLEQAKNDLAEMFKNRMQSMIGISMGMSGSGMKYDPFGRPYDNSPNNGQNPDKEEIEIPSETEKKQVDTIIRKLRERSGDRSRSREELDYYNRLLRQF